MNVESISGKSPLFISQVMNRHKVPNSAPPAGAKLFPNLMAQLGKTRSHGSGNGASANLLEEVMAAADPAKVQRAQVALQDLSNGKSSATNPMVALEGTLMTKFVDEMLPKSDHALYGGGLAGDTWRGFEVDQFGSALAKSDPLNFAKAPATIRLSANVGMGNLFGNALDGQPITRHISPFAS
jgi:hypothetical protein